jgi:hypothetical protein
MTQTFTAFTDRIRWVAQKLIRRVALLGDPEQYMQGWLNGKQVTALPDTCSEVMLIEEAHALE